MTLQRKPMTYRYRPTGFSRATRALIMDRDGWQCVPQVACEGGVTTLLIAHHRRNRGAGGSVDPVTNCAANGLACCHVCNGALESAWAAAEDARISGWKVSRYADPREVAVEYEDGWFLLTEDGQRIPYEAQDGAA